MFSLSHYIFPVNLDYRPTIPYSLDVKEFPTCTGYGFVYGVWNKDGGLIEKISEGYFLVSK
jgi:hypothetical protein